MATPVVIGIAVPCVFGLTVALYLLVAARLSRRGHWFRAGIAMFAISLLPVLWELWFLDGANSSANASLVFITVLIWPLVLMVMLGGAVRLVVRRAK